MTIRNDKCPNCAKLAEQIRGMSARLKKPSKLERGFHKKREKMLFEAYLKYKQERTSVNSMPIHTDESAFAYARNDVDAFLRQIGEERSRSEQGSPS